MGRALSLLASRMHASSAHPIRSTLLLVLAGLAWLSPGIAQTETEWALIKLAPVFSDHMVLPRDQPVTIWGTADRGVAIRVTHGDTVRTASEENGGFSVQLPAQPANAKPTRIEVLASKGNARQRIVLDDVLVGDLWLCTGQSNMRWRVEQCAEASDLMASADVPELRLIDFEGSLYPTNKRYDLAFLQALRPDNYYSTTGWHRASAASAKTFSAVAFAFGRRVARDAGVPIGILHNAIGGSPMAAFLPVVAGGRPPSVRKALTGWQQGDGYPAWCRTRVRQNLAAWFEKPDGKQPHHPFEPSFLFDAGIAPLKDLPIRGVVWYQGESDATDIPGDRPRNIWLNLLMFVDLIASFRRNWNQPELPFYYVQLPGLDRDWAAFRQMQASVAAGDPHADMAVAIDVGDPHDVHPRRKVPVGDRLARLALANVYGQDIATSGPRFARVDYEGSCAIVHFTHADGLRTIDNQPARAFWVAAADKVFHPAMATIEGTSVRLRSSRVDEPVAVRYAYSSDPKTNLVNNSRLPAAPFRSDTWRDATTAESQATGSFEDLAAGPLQRATSSQGTWSAAAGHAEITSRFAHSGRQCLHLHGGEARELVLTLTKAGPRRMSFVAERWTSRAPFTFRVDARIGARWREVYDGDRVRVGSRFLSTVEAELPNGVTALRFRSTSPEQSGVLIDDLQLSEPTPMRVVGVQHRRWVAPALHGKTSPITKIAVHTEGHTSPPSVTRMVVAFSDDTNLEGIEHVHALGQKLPAARVLEFTGNAALKNGSNELAVSVDLSPRASLSSRIRASVTEVTVGPRTRHAVDGTGTAQRVGVALRTKGQDDCHTYRIPGLVTTKQGTLIAVYDNRYRGSGDLPGDIDVGMSRSTDGGQTWEPMRVIMDMGDDPAWRYDGIGDPEVLVDEITGRIWVAATWSHGNRSWNGSGPGMKPEETGQFLLVHSDDDGKTWSEPRNITEQIKDPKWRFVLQGPGRGLTMRDGTLVLAAQYRSAPDGPHAGKPFSTMIHSKDRGETWTIGTGVKVDTTEAQLVELEDGVLMINCRDNRRGSRSVYTTDDLGKTWTRHPTSRHGLIEPVCMASLLRIDHATFGRLLVFSNPNTPAGRFDMTLKVSTDDGMTWPARWHTRYDQRPGAGYSCLTRVGDDHVGVVYEGHRELYYLRFPIRELLGR